MRVQIPAYTDRWMMGDRYGAVLAVATASIKTRAQLHARDQRRYPLNERIEVATVKLDKSGKTIRVILDDCQEV